MADESTILTDTSFDEIKKPDETEGTEPTTTDTEHDAEATVPTDELGSEPELGDADTDVDSAPEAELSDAELDKLTAPEADAEAPEGSEPEADAETTDEPKVDPLTVSQTGSPSADEAYPAGEPAIAPDLESAHGDDKAANEDGTDPAGQLPSVVDTEEAPTDTSAVNPMASAETTSTPAPEDHTGPLEGDVKVAADTSARDMAAVLSGSSVDAPKEEGDVAKADDADKSDEGDASGHVADDAPMPDIVPQPSKADAEAAKPLSAVATGPNQPAMDAMPEAAQQHMAQWLTPPDTNGQVEPGHGQLPNSRTLPGTQDDATAIAGEIKPVVANNATSDTAPTKAAPYHMPLVEGVKDDDKGSDEDGDDAVTVEGDDDGGEGYAEGFEGESDESGDVGSDDELSDAESGIFGDAKVENGPLGELAGEGIDAVKSAAEYAHTAQGQLQQIPVMLLELEHKDLLFRMREVLSEVVTLADRLFHRR